MHARRRHTWRRILGRWRCVCGLPWPCLGAWLDARRDGEEGRLRTNESVAASEVPGWVASTVPIFQVAHVGELAPAREPHSQGGGSC